MDCEYQYQYQLGPIRCEKAARWIMRDQCGKDHRYCQTHREANEMDGDWRSVEDGNMDELFTIPEVLSPRMAWLRKHEVETFFNDSKGSADAWSADSDAADVFATGATEDEAIFNLAKANGWKLWNEETP